MFKSQEQTVYTTSTGGKYHRSNCRYLRLSSYPIDLKSALSRYSPCSVCGPPMSIKIESMLNSSNKSSINEDESTISQSNVSSISNLSNLNSTRLNFFSNSTSSIIKENSINVVSKINPEKTINLSEGDITIVNQFIEKKLKEKEEIWKIDINQVNSKLSTHIKNLSDLETKILEKEEINLEKDKEIKLIKTKLEQFEKERPRLRLTGFGKNSYIEKEKIKILEKDNKENILKINYLDLHVMGLENKIIELNNKIDLIDNSHKLKITELVEKENKIEYFLDFQLKINNLKNEKFEYFKNEILEINHNFAEISKYLIKFTEDIDEIKSYIEEKFIIAKKNDSTSNKYLTEKLNDKSNWSFDLNFIFYKKKNNILEKIAFNENDLENKIQNPVCCYVSKHNNDEHVNVNNNLSSRIILNRNLGNFNQNKKNILNNFYLQLYFSFFSRAFNKMIFNQNCGLTFKLGNNFYSQKNKKTNIEIKDDRETSDSLVINENYLQNSQIIPYRKLSLPNLNNININNKIN